MCLSSDHGGGGGGGGRWTWSTGRRTHPTGMSIFCFYRPHKERGGRQCFHRHLSFCSRRQGCIHDASLWMQFLPWMHPPPRMHIHICLPVLLEPVYTLVEFVSVGYSRFVRDIYKYCYLWRWTLCTGRCGR